MGGLDFSTLWRPFIAFFKTPSKRDIDAIKDADHTYIRGHESQRSPCPFLNALANHNYLSVTPTLLPNSLTKQP